MNHTLASAITLYSLNVTTDCRAIWFQRRKFWEEFVTPTYSLCQFSGGETRINSGIFNKFIVPWKRRTNHCRGTKQIYALVDEKNGSLQGYSTNLKFSGREKWITAVLLNKFITLWTRKMNHCRTTQQIYNSVDEKNVSLQDYSINL